MFTPNTVAATQLFPASPVRQIRHQAEVSAGHTLLSLCTKSYSCLGQFVAQYSGPLDGRAEEMGPLAENQAEFL